MTSTSGATTADTPDQPDARKTPGTLLDAEARR